MEKPIIRWAIHPFREKTKGQQQIDQDKQWGQQLGNGTLTDALEVKKDCLAIKMSNEEKRPTITIREQTKSTSLSSETSAVQNWGIIESMQMPMRTQATPQVMPTLI